MANWGSIQSATRVQEKNIAVVIPYPKLLTNHANIATGAANITLTSAITAGSTANCVAAFDTDGFARIVGTVRANQTATLKVYQGLGADGLYNELFSVSVASGVTEGTGQRFNIPVLGDSAKITITNDAGANITSMAFEAFLITVDPGQEFDLAAVVDTELAAAIAAADNMTNPTTAQVIAHMMVYDGATWDRAPGTSASGTKVQPATGGAGVSDTTTQRVAFATDANTIQVSQTTPGTTNGVTLVPSTAAAANLLTSGTAAQVSNRVVKATAGTLFLAIGYNNNAATRYLQVFNAAALPADGTVPNLPPISVATGQNWSLNLGEYGYAFTTGIVIANSTTAATLTIASADQFINATYI